MAENSGTNKKQEMPYVMIKIVLSVGQNTGGAYCRQFQQTIFVETMFDPLF